MSYASLVRDENHFGYLHLHILYLIEGKFLGLMGELPLGHHDCNLAEIPALRFSGCASSLRICMMSTTRRLSNNS